MNIDYVITLEYRNINALEAFGRSWVTQRLKVRNLPWGVRVELHRFCGREGALEYGS
jgi:hypothetical protein